MKRVNGFKAHSAAADFVNHLNYVVANGEANIDLTYDPLSPLFLVVGVPRSGTTVLMQWLEQSGISVPNNLSARFAGNPYFAGLLQRLLTDNRLNFRGELTIPKQPDFFASDYGKTRGLLSPHEFSFYFRRFFPVTVGEKLTEEQLVRCNPDGFVKGLALFSSALERPIAVKALLIQYHLDLFLPFPNVHILHVHRDLVENICSLYRHRKIVAGDVNEWISVKPPQYDFLKEMAPLEQVAGQVYYTNKEIIDHLEKFPENRVITCSHEEFCNNPNSLYENIASCCVFSKKYTLPLYSGPQRFEIHSYDKKSSLYTDAKSALEKVMFNLVFQKRGD